MSVPDDDRTYRDRVVRVHEFVGDDGALRGFGFVGCYVTGPAVLFLRDHVVFMDNDLGGPDLESVLWDIVPGREHLVGVVLVENCHFERCTFSRIGFTGLPEVLTSLRSTVR